MVRVPFLPTHSSVLSLHRPTCTWPGQSLVARVAEPLSVARVVEPLLLAGATMEAFGTAPEGASGTDVGGHTA